MIRPSKTDPSMHTDLSRIVSIEKEIFQILKNRSQDMTEASMILSHLLVCSVNAMNVDTDVLFSKLAQHYKQMYKKEKPYQLKF